jgi:FkbM family methyltransferase
MTVNAALTGSDLKECLETETPTILEIGSNFGDTTGWFLETFASPTIFCFEPDLRAIARFRSNIGDQSGVLLIETAVGARDGTTKFFMSGGRPPGNSTFDWDASGSIRQPKKVLEAHPWCKFERQIEVSVRQLDSWCMETAIGPIDFIWMDVQGAELDVIEGAEATLAKVRFLYTEYSNLELYQGQPTLKKLLQGLGRFDVLVRYPNDLLMANTALVSPLERRRLRAILRGSIDENLGQVSGSSSS